MKLFRISYWMLPLVLLVGATSGCYYDNEEELYPGPPCDTTGTVSYATDIVPILTNNCITCHSNGNAQSAGAGISFEGYANVQTYLNSSGVVFIKVVQHAPGFPQMPKGGNRLADCNILKIEKWVNSGFPNN